MRSGRNSLIRPIREQPAHLTLLRWMHGLLHKPLIKRWESTFLVAAGAVSVGLRTASAPLPELDQPLVRALKLRYKFGGISAC